MTNVAFSDFAITRRTPAPMSILIVNDEQAMRELYMAAATQSGLNASAVSSAEQALSVLEQKPIDILLTDTSSCPA